MVREAESVCVPHPRGDEPLVRYGTQTTSRVFPTRMGMNRRKKPMNKIPAYVFPTRVGMNRGQVVERGGREVFPTRVGMNRSRAENRHRSAYRVPHPRGDEPVVKEMENWWNTRVPHPRGDEPTGRQPERASKAVFPTRVGMNRYITFSANASRCVFPTRVGMNRTSAARTPRTPACSPPAWG